MRHARPSRIEPWVRVAVPALVGIGVLLVGSLWLAASAFVVARVAYVTFVGATLAREEARSEPRSGLARWERFRRGVLWLMSADAVAFGALSLVTRDSLGWPSRPWAIAVGAALFVTGVFVKRWAAASLPTGSYTWRDFFVPDEATPPANGPYRWLKDPMYTIGYAHAYGFALAARSLWGLGAAAFAQCAILSMYLLVERPHFRRRVSASRSETSAVYP